jgi:hypothetical protein
MALFVAEPGTWTGVWLRKKQRPLLQAQGLAAFTPACTSVADRLPRSGRHGIRTLPGGHA